MNILLTINDISITGGAERVCINLANALLGLNHSVEILSFYRKNRDLPYHTNAKLTFINDFGEDIQRARFYKNPLSKIYFKNLYKFILSLKVKRDYKHIDTIITNDWTYTPFLKNKATHYIKINHLNFSKYNKRNNLFDTLILLSKMELHIWQKYHKNIKVIPNFIPEMPKILRGDLQEMAQAKQNLSQDLQDMQDLLNSQDLADSQPILPLSKSQKCVISVGRMESGDQKGFLRLLDIWKILQDSNPHSKHHRINLAESRRSENAENAEFSTQSHSQENPLQSKQDSNATLHNWHLVIIGDGELKDAIDSKIKALKLENSVILKPFTKDIGSEYQNADIYAMSSHYEGFGMVLAEAGSYGLPCVAFDIPTGPSDIIEHNVSGLLVENNDLVAYAKALRVLISDEAMRKRMGIRARERIEEHFSQRAIMPMWSAILAK